MTANPVELIGGMTNGDNVPKPALFHADLIAQMVEKPADTVNEGDVWDAETETFAPPAP